MAAPGEPVSAGTFRAVVAAVLVGALVLLSIIAFAVMQPQSPSPAPSATPTARSTPTAPPTPAPTPGLVFGEVGVTAVGSVPRGGASGTTLVLRFVEPNIDAIPDSAGSFTVTLADDSGVGTTVAFSRTPLLDAPGSLGVSAELVAPNVLKVSVVASDTLNIEPITLSGFGIRASPEAALGSINAALGGFSGSLAGGVANVALPPLGNVVAGP